MVLPNGVRVLAQVPLRLSDLPEIVDYVRKGPLPDAIHQLVTNAQQRMNQPSDTQPSKPDDLTIVSFRPGRKTEDGRRKTKTRTALVVGESV